jgi:hypothetical protein
MPLDWLDGVTLTAEAAFSAATGSYGIWDVGLWNTATWGPDVVLTDVSAYLRSFITGRRFSRDLQAWEAGTSTWVLSNRDGRFSPSNMAGPYVVAGVSGIRPWQPVRLRATYAGITYPLYQGYTKGWQESWAGGHADATSTMSCADELARLAGFDGLGQNPVGGSETTGQRIQRILDNAGHAGVRNIDVGRNTCQATTLAANAVTEIKLTADSDGGAFWVEADGTVTFDSGLALIENTRSNTVQATFSDTGVGGLLYADATVEFTGDLTVNIAAFARVGSTAQVAVDDTSRALYGDRRLTRTDLVCEADSQALGLAQLWVARYKDPERRITQLVVKPRGDPARLFPQVLGRQVRDLIRVIVHPIGGYAIQRDCFIAGISHVVTGDDWVTTFDLWSATPYTAFTTSRFNTGLWDSATWFF